MIVSNISVGVVTLLPVVLVLEVCRRSKASDIKYLICGVVLVMWAVLVFAVLSESMKNIDVAGDSKAIGEGMQFGLKKVVSIWMYALPAISLAIGVNLITVFYSRD